MFVSIEDDAGRTDDLGSVGAQLADGDDAFQPGAAAGVCVCQVDFAVFIPNGAGIDNALNLFYKYGLAPRTFCPGRLYHEYALVRVSPENIEFAVMMADTGSPHTVAVFRTFGSGDRRKGGGYGGADNRPVHQVFGMENL